MTTLPARISEALQSKSLASRFSHGRYESDMKWSAERQFALQAIQKNPDLYNCSEESISTALLDVAYSGLSLSPSLGQAYLIPYGNICTFAPGYRGFLHLAFKAGTIKSVQVNLVRDSDAEFRVWTDEHGRHLIHNENQHKHGNVTHSYCIANLTAGGPPIIEVMNKTQIAAVEEAATKRRKGGMVWRGPFRDEMCKKAVLRRASKMWPKDDGGVLEHMIGISDRHDGLEFDDVSKDNEPPEQELCISLDQHTELNDILLANGVAPDAAPVWLTRYANAVGYSSIENLPARLFEESRQTIDERSKKAASAH